MVNLFHNLPRIAFFLCLATVSASIAQEAPTNRAANIAFVQAQDKAWRARYGGDSNAMIRPALLADRAKGEVRFWAEATGLTNTSPVEFFLIDLASGHDYEAAAVSFARPSDVHAALEFIGMRAGQPCDPSAMRFWPRGERVIVRCEWQHRGTNCRARIESLMVDTSKGRPLPSTGLVFTGSYRVPGQPATNNYAADTLPPQAIAGNFNERSLVLDLPWQAQQSEVYGRYMMNSAMPLERGKLIQVVMEPEHRDGRLRVVQLQLAVAPGTNSAASAIGELKFTLRDPAQSAPLADGDLTATLAAFKRLGDAERDPFVTLRFDPRLNLAAVRAVGEFINSIDSEQGIRVDAPPPGHPFYRAFAPPDRFRNRAERPSQPWELRLTGADGLPGVLSRIEEQFDALKGASTFTVHDTPVASVAELTAALNKQEWPKVIFIYAGKGHRYGHIQPLYAALAENYPTIYIFVD